ncbi:MAG TPA: antibiotic biosynthesis monooxygenase family protein [Blastococcus sp.]
MTAATGDGGAGVRTILRMRTREGCEAQFEEAWRQAAAEISKVAGNLRQELVRDADDPRTFLITADWIDRAAVDAFGRSSARELLTTALRDLREDASRSTYEVLYTVDAEKGRHVRVDITTTVGPGEEELFERAYKKTVERLHGTPGLIREELLKEPAAPIYHIFAEWETERDFNNWVDDPSHADQTASLIRWLSVDFERQVFEIRYRPPEHRSDAWAAASTPDGSFETVPLAPVRAPAAWSPPAAGPGRPAPTARSEAGAATRPDHRRRGPAAGSGSRTAAARSRPTASGPVRRSGRRATGRRPSW